MTLVSTSAHPGGAPVEAEGDCIFLALGKTAPVLQSCDGAGNGLTIVTVGSHPWGVAYDPSNGYIYVTNSQAGSLTELRGIANAETVSVGRDPVAAAFDSSNGDVYVADSGQDAVSVVSATTMQVLATVNVGVNPQGLAYSSSSNAVYVTNNGDGTISEIASGTNSVVATLNVGGFPSGIAFDQGNGLLYVAQEAANNVTVVNPGTNSVSGSIAVGDFPTAVAYDPVERGRVRDQLPRRDRIGHRQLWAGRRDDTCREPAGWGSGKSGERHGLRQLLR